MAKGKSRDYVVTYREMGHTYKPVVKAGSKTTAKSRVVGRSKTKKVKSVKEYKGGGVW